MGIFRYSADLALLALIVGGFITSAHILRRALVDAWSGAPALLATLILTVSITVVTCEALGIFGLLSTIGLLIASVFTAGALWWWRVPTAPSSSPRRPPTRWTMPAMAIAASLLTAIHWAGPVLKSLDVGMYRQDSLWYHLPTAAWFAQNGSVGGLLFTDPLKLAVWYYPDNSELLHSIGMIVLGNDLLSPIVNFGWMGVALLAGWSLGRPFGLSAVTLLGTALVVDSDMMLVQAGNAPSDIVALACLLAAIAILANGKEPGVLLIAALAAGLAIGTKVTMLVPVGIITVGILVGRRGVRGWRTTGLWVGGMLATGGFWYLRNLIHASNPLPWINFGPLPGPDQEDLYPRAAHSVADYIANSHAWTAFFFPGLGETLGPIWPVLAFGAFAGVVLGLRRRQPRAVRILAIAAAATVVAYVFIPISASGPNGAPSGFASNLRYVAPAIAIGLVLLPLCETQTLARRVIFPVYVVVFVVSALGSDEWIQPAPLAAVAIGAIAVLTPIWLMRQQPPKRRVAVLAAVAFFVLVAGYAQQREYFDQRYRPAVAPPLDNPGFRATEQWQAIQGWAIDQHNLKIGIVGTPAAYGQYIFYGDDLSNEVRYLGQPRSHGGFGPISHCAEWNVILRDSGIDVLVVTPEDPGIARLPPQISWTHLGRAAVPILQEPPAGVFRIARPADPSGCSRRGRGLGAGGFFGPQIPEDRGVPIFPEGPSGIHP